jgi:hypothetical protein
MQLQEACDSAAFMAHPSVIYATLTLNSVGFSWWFG